eukprot:snap_masked-scaffold_7-processed-gene-6.33-mRNA-1 protein AED:1.00 eAED:1.00 QI:0/-1/0/0/-1/1/1/0/158
MSGVKLIKLHLSISPPFHERLTMLHIPEVESKKTMRKRMNSELRPSYEEEGICTNIKKELTIEERRKYNARAVRRHRKRVRQELEQAYEEEDALKDEVETLRNHAHMLEIYFRSLKEGSSQSLWTRDFLLEQNRKLREVNRNAAYYKQLLRRSILTSE